MQIHITKKISSIIKHASALIFFGVLVYIGLVGANALANNPTVYKGNGFGYGSINDEAVLSFDINNIPDLNGDGTVDTQDLSLYLSGGDVNVTDSNLADTGIGYLSFGCGGLGGACDDTATPNFPAGYGVRINTDAESPDEGKFYGYAWSSNYGWVSFYQNDVSVCGAGGGLEIPGDVQTFISSPGESVVLDGWARVINFWGLGVPSLSQIGDVNGDGIINTQDVTAYLSTTPDWNGCIRFGSSSTLGSVGSEYASKLTVSSANELTLSGWAYGGEGIGWISFDCPYCRVNFSVLPPELEDECIEADDPEVCDDTADVIDADLALYIGPANVNDPSSFIPNTTYSVPITGEDTTETVQLLPLAGALNLQNCLASYTTLGGGGQASGWNGQIIDTLVPNDFTNSFFVDISNYQENTIYQFTIECYSEDMQDTIEASAFATIFVPPAIVSMSASPNPIDVESDPTGSTTLSWNFDNVQDNSCEISGFVDTTPTIEDDGVLSIDDAFAASIGFSSWSPNSPGSDGLNGIINFPVYFEITCLNFSDQEVSDGVYITTTELGCTPSMEAAGYCSNAINPIFEEF